MDAPFSIAALPEVRHSVRPDLLERPDSAVPCIRRAARRAALLRVHGPASDNAPVWVRDPALDNVPAAQEHPDLFRLRVKPHGRRVRVMVRAAAARHTRRPRKAR